MLHAAAELICERGFGETRIADVAKPAPVSSASSSTTSAPATACWSTPCATPRSRSTKPPSTCWPRSRLALRLSCSSMLISACPHGRGRDQRCLGPVAGPVGAGVSAPRGQGGPGRARRAVARHDRAGGGQEDRRPRPDVDVRLFALEFSALLDGLSIQVALDDPEINSDVAYDIAMEFAEQRLVLPAEKSVRSRRWQGRRARSSATGSSITGAELRWRTRTASCERRRPAPRLVADRARARNGWAPRRSAHSALPRRRAPGCSGRGRPRPGPRRRAAWRCPCPTGSSAP